MGGKYQDGILLGFFFWLGALAWFGVRCSIGSAWDGKGLELWCSGLGGLDYNVHERFNIMKFLPLRSV